MFLLGSNIPDIPFQLTGSKMTDLFRNFNHNWLTLSPALYILFGTIFGFFMLKLLKNKFGD